MLESIKMIVTDLDGTLLGKGGVLSDYTKRVLKDLNKNGVVVVPATSRSYNNLPYELLESDDIPICICSNGAAIVDNITRDTLTTKPLLNHEVVNILDRLKNIDKIVSINVKGDVYSDQSFYKICKDKNIKKTGESQRIVLDSEQELIAQLMSSKHVEKLHLNFIDPKEREATFKKLETYENITVASSGKTNVEITSSNVSKSTAIGWLAKHYNIDENQILTIGDGINDIQMLKDYKHSVAMLNADDHVKASAKYITYERHDEDGFAKFMQREVIA